MTIWGALAGGLIGTVVLTSGLRGAQEAGWTRMDVPLLLGTAFTASRSRAQAIGFFAHFANGLAFSLVYYAVFRAVGEASWWFGLALGGAHALFSGGVLVNVLLPVVHPRMGTPWTDAEETPLLEPPGFLLFNYGPATMWVTIALHLAYGAIVGLFAGGF